MLAGLRSLMVANPNAGGGSGVFSRSRNWIRELITNPYSSGQSVKFKGAGSRLISAELLTADFAAGAPRNEDGTINLVEFAAWIVKGDEANANQSE